MSKTVSIDQLDDVVKREFLLYSQSIIDNIKKEAKKSINQLVKDSKASAPVGHRNKHYRDSIKSKKQSENDRSITYVWYVAGADYRLTHLLEYGHATRNGGRVEGTHFLKKSSDPILEAYVKKVEEIVKNG